MRKGRSSSKWVTLCLFVISPILFSSNAFGDPCGSQTAFFTVEPLEPGAYSQIDPLGATNPSDHTFPTVHTYMMLTDNTVPSPVYAPGNMALTNVAMTQNLSDGSSDYSISFSPCTEVTGYFLHITTLTTDILDKVGDFSDCATYSNYRYCYKDVSIEMTAGTLLGYAGGPNSSSGALDFGLRDSRITPIYYVNPDRLVNDDQLYVVCPYDYYEAGAVRNNLYAKLRIARTDDPVCGTVALDVQNTAQGRWYLEGSTGSGEADHLALVPSNKTPLTVGVLSVGNSSVGTDAYYFDFASSGLINRSFSAISFDGNIYCFDNLRTMSLT